MDMQMRSRGIRFGSRLSTIIAVALFGTASAGLAQAPLTGAVGETIRVRTQLTPDWLRGTLSRVNDTSLVIEPNTPQIIPLRSIVAVQRRTGRNYLVGGLIGLPIGLIVGGFAGLLIWPEVGHSSGEFADLVLTVDGTLLGAATGAVLGTVIGSTQGPERWTPLRWR